MHCRYCGGDSVVVIVIPATVNEMLSDSPFACEPCAIKHRIFCVQHNVPHLGFRDGTHGCSRCAEAAADQYESIGSELILHINQIFPPEEVERIDEYLARLDFGGYPAPRNVIRALAMIAQRANHTLEETIEAFKLGKSAGPIAAGSLPRFPTPPIRMP